MHAHLPYVTHREWLVTKILEMYNIFPAILKYIHSHIHLYANKSDYSDILSHITQLLKSKEFKCGGTVWAFILI